MVNYLIEPLFEDYTDFEDCDSPGEELFRGLKIMPKDGMKL